MAKIAFNPMNLFRTKTDAEANKEVIRQAETLKDLDKLKQLARDMLADKRYQTYRQEFENMFGKVLRDLLSYRHQDNDVYAVNVRTIIQQLNDLLAILNTPINFLNYVTVQEIELPKKSPAGGE